MIGDGFIDDILQECRTWLNIASNQELNRADYDTVRQSYSAALECARRAGEAKLEVCCTPLNSRHCLASCGICTVPVQSCESRRISNSTFPGLE